MKKRNFLLFVIPAFFMIFALSFPSSAQAYSLGFKFEIGTAVGFNFPSLNTSYHSHYAPTFQPGAYESSADQTLHLKGKRANELSAVFCYYPLENFGFQVLADYSRNALKGKNSDYNVSLDSPEHLWHRTLAWPDTDGRFKQFNLSFNAAARFELNRLIVLGISGGASLFDFSGKFSSLGYTKFLLGEHSTLFIKDYKLSAEFESTKWGFNAGGEFDIDLVFNTTLYMDIRYFHCPEVQAKLKLVSNPIITEPLDQVENEINLGSLAVNPSFFRVNLGFKFVF